MAHMCIIQACQHVRGVKLYQCSSPHSYDTFVGKLYTNILTDTSRRGSRYEQLEVVAVADTKDWHGAVTVVGAATVEWRVRTAPELVYVAVENDTVDAQGHGLGTALVAAVETVLCPPGVKQHGTQGNIRKRTAATAPW